MVKYVIKKNIFTKNQFIMKKIIVFILLGMFYTFSYAQTAQNTMVEFNKATVPAVNISIANYDVETVRDALKARLERMGGLKGSSSKGFTLYADQVFVNFDPAKKFDIYTKIDAGSKKDNHVLITLMVSLGNENFISVTENPELNQKMLDFLTDFVANSLKDFDVVKKTTDLTAALDKMEKEHKTLVSERDKLKTDLENKEKAVAAKAEDIAKTKQALEALK